MHRLIEAIISGTSVDALIEKQLHEIRRPTELPNGKVTLILPDKAFMKLGLTASSEFAAMFKAFKISVIGEVPRPDESYQGSWVIKATIKTMSPPKISRAFKRMIPFLKELSENHPKVALSFTVFTRLSDAVNKLNMSWTPQTGVVSKSTTFEE